MRYANRRSPQAIDVLLGLSRCVEATASNSTHRGADRGRLAHLTKGHGRVADVTKGHRGVTLIEWIIVVAIIAVLAAIGSTQYANYLQRSADQACLGEAKAYMNQAVAAAALNETPAPYQPQACHDGESMTVDKFRSGAALRFTPHTRSPLGGGAQGTTCQAATGACALQP